MLTTATCRQDINLINLFTDIHKYNKSIIATCSNNLSIEYLTAIETDKYLYGRFKGKLLKPRKPVHELRFLQDKVPYKVSQN